MTYLGVACQRAAVVAVVGDIASCGKDEELEIAEATIFFGKVWKRSESIA